MSGILRLSRYHRHTLGILVATAITITAALGANAVAASSTTTSAPTPNPTTASVRAVSSIHTAIPTATPTETSIPTAALTPTPTPIPATATIPAQVLAATAAQIATVAPTAISTPTPAPAAPTPTLAPVSNPAPTLATTTILSLADLDSAAAAAGWDISSSAWASMRAIISTCEDSSLNPAIANLNDPNGGSWGLAQLNYGWFAKAGYSQSDYANPVVNLATALWLYHARGDRFGGAGGWTCANNLGIG